VIAQELGATVIVDDNPETIRRAHLAGLTVLSKDHRYTRPLVDAGFVKTFDSWHLGQSMIMDSLYDC
jgi:hypothetical protein